MLDFLYLTELFGLTVHDIRGRRLGVIRDAAIVPLVDPVRVDRYLVGGGWSWLTVRHDQVERIGLDGIWLKDEQLTPYHSDEYLLRLMRDLLDQQIIDSHGRKVVRVTDVTFEILHRPDGDLLQVLEVDIGLRSMLRRLLQGMVPRPWIRRLQRRIPPNSIRWEFVNIVESDPQRRLRLNISTRRLENMHPADLADIVEELSPEDREAIIASMDSEAAAETLTEVDPDIQTSILESLDTEKAADIIEEMEPHEAADALGELEEETSEEILEEMEPEPKTEVEELLEYDEDEAGGMMAVNYVALPETATVSDAMVALAQNEELMENLNTIFLVDSGERLSATVPLARLFRAAGTTPLKELATETLIRVHDGEDQERITELFDKYNLITLPVVDEEGKLSGVITADEIISVLRNQ